MSLDVPSSSRQAEEVANEHSQPLYITHKVSKMDNLAGLAIKYNVAVADIKRANGFLSDTAMFAKDTLLIPTRALSVGVEYSTWAGMIVTQFGKIPGDRGNQALGLSGNEGPKQSASLDHLQQYYGTGDSSSEPPDFRPGDPEGTDGSVSGTEIELSDMDHLGRLTSRGNSEEASPISGSVEYAGSRSGNLADERLRRRRASELLADAAAAQSSETAGSANLDAPDPIAGGAVLDRGFIQPPSQSSPQRGGQHRRSNTQGSGMGQRRESILERLKRVASQPALAAALAPSAPRLSDVVATPLTECLPPLPPGTRRPAIGINLRQSKDIQKAD